jgi:glycosyltransferase involved in cell wall biosynthesis
VAQTPPKLIAIFSAYNEARYLPSFFENIAPLVDGAIGLDDGSTDGSGELIERAPCVLKTIRRPVRDPDDWNEAVNRGMLREAAFEAGADWIIGLDPDERLEKSFRERAYAGIERAEREDGRAYIIHCFELWDAPDQCRVDGVWAKKWVGRFFKADPGATYETAQLHGQFAPVSSLKYPDGRWRMLDLRFYHLKMIHAADRAARRAKYNRLDANKVHQPAGYDYLTDDAGIVLEKIAPGREYEPLFTG